MTYELFDPASNNYVGPFASIDEIREFVADLDPDRVARMWAEAVDDSGEVVGDVVRL